MSDENATVESTTPETTEAASEETSAEVEETTSEDSGGEASESSSETEVQAETVEELQDEVQDAIDNGATEQDVKDMIEEFELKVNGKTYKKKIDLNDKDAIKKELQMAMAGRGALQKNAELEKLYKNEIERLRNNPWEVLEELGMDPLELSEGKINEYIEEQKKSPEQVEKEKLERELIQARQEADRLKKEQESIQFQRMEEQAAQQLEDEIQEALHEHKTLPKSPKTVSRIADALLWAYDNGFPDATVKDVLPMVEDGMKNELNSFFDELPLELFEQYINQKNLDRYRKSKIPKSATNNLTNVKETVQPKKKTEEDIKERVKAKDYFRNLR